MTEVDMEAEGVAADMEEEVAVMEAVMVVVAGSEVAVEAAATVVEEEAIRCALKWTTMSRAMIVIVSITTC